MKTEIQKSNLDKLAEKIIEIKQQYQGKAIDMTLDFKWNIGKEISVSRGTQSKSYRFLSNKTGIHYRELQRDVKFYETYLNKDYPKLAWRKFKNELLIEEPKENKWLKLFNIWYFQERDKNLGQEHPGNIPGQIAENVLYYFTKENDLIVDPFGGGGSTIDACKKHKRKCLAYDIKPVRDDIQYNDITNGFPEETKNCDLIFLDPPYWSQKKKDYIETSISALNIGEFLKAMDKLAKDCHDIVKKDGCVSLIIGATQIADIFFDHAFDCYEIFKKYFKPVVRINVPYSTQQYTAIAVQRAKDKKQLLNLYRDLIIFQK